MTPKSMATKFSTLALTALALSSCGQGAKIVSDLKFSSETVNGKYYAGFDAKVNLSGAELPYAHLPVLDSKNPARSFGYVEIGGDKVSVRVDVAGASQSPILDGGVLPNGRPIPVSLPEGVTPIALPVAGSNTKVYLAVGRKNLMAGVAVTLKPTDQMGGTIGDLLRFPANVFFPFTIASNVKGSAGIFTGSHFGLGVFAVQSSDITTGMPSVYATSMDRIGTKDFSKPEKFGVKSQSTTNSRLFTIDGALREIDSLQLD